MAHGPNVRKLIVRRMSFLAVPNGGGLPDAIALLLDPSRLGRVAREAAAWVEESLALVKATSGNPYGDDDEAIAAEILRQIERKTFRGHSTGGNR
jgi:hypothetical protein